jgi:hypothetical protein
VHSAQKGVKEWIYLKKLLWMRASYRNGFISVGLCEWNLSIQSCILSMIWQGSGVQICWFIKAKCIFYRWKHHETCGYEFCWIYLLMMDLLDAYKSLIVKAPASYSAICQPSDVTIRRQHIFKALQKLVENLPWLSRIEGSKHDAWRQSSIWRQQWAQLLPTWNITIYMRLITKKELLMHYKEFRGL